MTAIRLCEPTDISRLNLCNLDPLTENYAQKFYYEYIAKWPTMFIVAENQQGHIIAYGEKESENAEWPSRSDYMSRQSWEKWNRTRTI